MLKKRIIPCLDIQNGRTVKGVHFENIRDAGNPIELAKKYAAEGADELVFLDITATIEKRKILIELVREIAQNISIPFTVGGGIQSVDDAFHLVQAGADKISLNSAAILNPPLIQSISKKLGSQCVVLAIDTKFENNQWKVYRSGGRIETDLLTLDWTKKGVELGAGEILLTSMNNDGAKTGFALDITQQVAQDVKVPVIASGGAGKIEHFAEVFRQTQSTGALAASVFHFGEIPIPELKTYLKQQNIPIR